MPRFRQERGTSANPHPNVQPSVKKLVTETFQPAEDYSTYPYHIIETSLHGWIRLRKLIQLLGDE